MQQVPVCPGLGVLDLFWGVIVSQFPWPPGLGSRWWLAFTEAVPTLLQVLLGLSWAQDQ